MDAPTLMEACVRDLSTAGEDWFSRVGAWKKRVGAAAYAVAAQTAQVPDVEVFHLVRWSPAAVASLAARKDLPEPLLDVIMEDWLARAVSGDPVAERIARSLMGHPGFHPGNTAFAMAWDMAAIRPGENKEKRLCVARMLLECQRLTDEHLAILAPLLEPDPVATLGLLRHPSAGPASWTSLTKTTPTVDLLEPLMDIDPLRRDPTVARWLHHHLRDKSMASSVGWKLWADAPALQFAAGLRWLLDPEEGAPKPGSVLAPPGRAPYTYEQVVDLLSRPSYSDTRRVAWLLTHARPDALTGTTMDEVTAMTSSSDPALREAAFLALGKYP